MSESNAYAEAGVNIQAADTAIELMKGWIEKSRRCLLYTSDAADE